MLHVPNTDLCFYPYCYIRPKNWPTDQGRTDIKCMHLTDKQATGIALTDLTELSQCNFS